MMNNVIKPSNSPYNSPVWVVLLLNSSVDQRRLESANLTLYRWIPGYDYGELLFGCTSPFIYVIIQNALIKTNIQSSASAILIMIRDTNSYIECPDFTGSRIESKLTVILHYFDRELE